MSARGSDFQLVCFSVVGKLGTAPVTHIWYSWRVEQVLRASVFKESRGFPKWPVVKIRGNSTPPRKGGSRVIAKGGNETLIQGFQEAYRN